MRYYPIPIFFHDDLLTIIKDYWGAFFEEGLRRPALGYVFYIDTGDDLIGYHSYYSCLNNVR